MAKGTGYEVHIQKSFEIFKMWQKWSHPPASLSYQQRDRKSITGKEVVT
jgi:hypothetical protein